MQLLRYLLRSHIHGVIQYIVYSFADNNSLKLRSHLFAQTICSYESDNSCEQSGSQERRTINQVPTEFIRNTHACRKKSVRYSCEMLRLFWYSHSLETKSPSLTSAVRLPYGNRKVILRPTYILREA